MMRTLFLILMLCNLFTVLYVERKCVFTLGETERLTGPVGVTSRRGSGCCRSPALKQSSQGAMEKPPHCQNSYWNPDTMVTN